MEYQDLKTGIVYTTWERWVAEPGAQAYRVYRKAPGHPVGI